jgi:hypothetical protein
MRGVLERLPLSDPSNRRTPVLASTTTSGGWLVAAVVLIGAGAAFESRRLPKLAGILGELAPTFDGAAIEPLAEHLRTGDW